MKNLKTQQDKSYCKISHTVIYSGDNNDLICRKIYQGDWGDWDDKNENNLEDQEMDRENNSFNYEE